MEYFKHLSKLGESTSINNLIDTHGIEYYAHWILFLELMCDKWDGDPNCTFDINLSVISRKVRIKSSKKLATFVQLLPNFFEITIKIFPTFAQITYLKLLEIKENRGGLRTKKSSFEEQRLLYIEEEEEVKEEEEGKSATLAQSATVPAFYVFDLWCKEISNLKILSGARKKKIHSLKKIFTTKESWANYIQIIKSSDFLMGRNDRNWKADFDWCLKESNILKILEGKYNNKTEVTDDKEAILRRYEQYKKQQAVRHNS